MRPIDKVYLTLVMLLYAACVSIVSYEVGKKAAGLHALSLEWVIVIFLLSLAGALGTIYYWRKNRTLPSTPKLATTIDKPSWRFAIPLLALAALIAFDFIPFPALSSAIEITKVETLPDLYQASTYPIGKRPFFNVHYVNNGSSIVKPKLTWNFVYLSSLPNDWGDKEQQYEDEAWEKLKAERAVGQKYAPSGDSAELPPHKPRFFTIFENPEFPQNLVQNVADSKSVVYVLVMLDYRDVFGQHEADFCGYIYGNLRVFHSCNRHNT